MPTLPQLGYCRLWLSVLKKLLESANEGIQYSLKRLLLLADKPTNDAVASLGTYRFFARSHCAISRRPSRVKAQVDVILVVNVAYMGDGHATIRSYRTGVPYGGLIYGQCHDWLACRRH